MAFPPKKSPIDDALSEVLSGSDNAMRARLQKRAAPPVSAEDLADGGADDAEEQDGEAITPEDKAKLEELCAKYLGLR
jgi:hypothetical protein